MNGMSQGNLKSMTVEAVVIRADGTREEMGVIGAWHANPIINLWYQCRIKLSRLRKR